MWVLKEFHDLHLSSNFSTIFSIQPSLVYDLYSNLKEERGREREREREREKERESKRGRERERERANYFNTQTQVQCWYQTTFQLGRQFKCLSHSIVVCN